MTFFGWRPEPWEFWVIEPALPSADEDTTLPLISRASSEEGRLTTSLAIHCLNEIPESCSRDLRVRWGNSRFGIWILPASRPLRRGIPLHTGLDFLGAPKHSAASSDKRLACRPEGPEKDPSLDPARACSELHPILEWQLWSYPQCTFPLCATLAGKASPLVYYPALLTLPGLPHRTCLDQLYLLSHPLLDTRISKLFVYTLVVMWIH
jgi:hypothetical protein